MNLLDKIAYDSGGYTVQEILSSFSKKILEIIDLVNKNEEVCDDAHTLIENIRNEVVPELVEDIMKELQDDGYFDTLVNVTLIEQLRTELTNLLNQTITDYTNRLDNFDSQLDNKADKTTVGSSKGIVNLTFDEIRDYSPNGLTPLSSYNDYDYLISLFEELRNNNNDYIKRNIIVVDTSQTYNIYEYVLEPKNVVGSVFINSGIHGYEKGSGYACLELIKLLLTSERPQLKFIRNNVRVVIIPFANPWGYVHHTRENSRGIDCNRNYDFKFSTSGLGTSAFSENETQCVRKVLNKYQNTLKFVIDSHHFGTPDPTTLNTASSKTDYITWTSKYENNYFSEMINIMENIASGNYDITTGYSASSLDNYVNHNMEGCCAVTTELDMGKITNNGKSASIYGKSSIRCLLNMYINYILMPFGNNSNLLKEPTLIRLFKVPSSGSIILDGKAQSYDTDIKVDFPIKTHGIIEVNGTIDVEFNNTACRIAFVPVLRQKGGEQGGDEDWYNSYYETYQYSPYTRYNTDELVRQTFPISGAMRVLPTNLDVKNFEFILRAYLDKGGQDSAVAKIKKVNIYIKYTPSESGYSVKSFTFDGTNNVQTYPEVVDYKIV